MDESSRGHQAADYGLASKAPDQTRQPLPGFKSPSSPVGVFDRHLAADRDSIVCLAGYLSADDARYISPNSRVTEVLAKKQDCIYCSIRSSF